MLGVWKACLSSPANIRFVTGWHGCAIRLLLQVFHLLDVCWGFRAGGGGWLVASLRSSACSSVPWATSPCPRMRTGPAATRVQGATPTATAAVAVVAPWLACTPGLQGAPATSCGPFAALWSTTLSGSLGGACHLLCSPLCGVAAVAATRGSPPMDHGCLHPASPVRMPWRRGAWRCCTR